MRSSKGNITRKEADKDYEKEEAVDQLRETAAGATRKMIVDKYGNYTNYSIKYADKKENIKVCNDTNGRVLMIHEGKEYPYGKMIWNGKETKRNSYLGGAGFC